jgi:uncharacterized protein YegL
MPASRVTSRNPWHMVLVLDDSGSMSGQPSQDLNEAMKDLIDALVTASMGQKPYFRVSVIAFGSNYQTLAEAVPETDLDEGVVANFRGSSGSTNAAAALDEAARILRNNPGQETDFEPFVFFLSDGHPDSASTALQAADKIKKLSLPSGSPRIVALGFGSVDDDFMGNIASNRELYKKLNSSKDIVSLLPAIGTIGTQAGGAKDVEQAIMKL